MANAEPKKTILVADDDPAILDSVSQLLELMGYAVKTAVDGETVSIMRDELPDLLLLDIWMSGQDGCDVCRLLKAQPETKHIPIILFSANKDTKRMAEESGADDFLLKPFEMRELLEKIQALVV